MTSSPTNTQQLHSHMEELHISPLTAAQPHTTTSSLFQLLTLLPSSLLALVASNLPLVSLLHLQRCSSTLHRLRSNESYMAVAWQRTALTLSTKVRLHEWTLPLDECIIDGRECFIPVGVWQTALPVLRAVVNRVTGLTSYDRHWWLSELVRQEQPTKWIEAKYDEDDRWLLVDYKETADEVVDEYSVEVLRDVDWLRLDREVIPTYRVLEVRCRHVLQACPYLQHLHLIVDASVHQPPSHSDTFALLPRLRSLHIEQRDDDRGLVSMFDFPAMLDSLPHLTSLRCREIRRLDIAGLLAIASHCTLDELHIDSSLCRMADDEWIGRDIQFPITAAEDEMLVEDERLAKDERLAALHGNNNNNNNNINNNNNNNKQLDAHAKDELDNVQTALTHFLSTPNEPLTDSSRKEKEWEEVRVAMERMRTALTRTQPTESSCRVRLSLADWLHRRLWRGELHKTTRHTNLARRKWRLRFYRLQVALLRSTLQSQLSGMGQQQ